MNTEIADALNFAKVKVKGRYMHEEEMHVYGRRMGSVAGYHVVTPLIRTDLPDSKQVETHCVVSFVVWEDSFYAILFCSLLFLKIILIATFYIYIYSNDNFQRGY